MKEPIANPPEQILRKENAKNSGSYSLVSIATITIHKSFANKNEPLIQLMSFSQMNNSSKPLNWKEAKQDSSRPGKLYVHASQNSTTYHNRKYVHVSVPTSLLPVNDNEKHCLHILE